MLTLDKFYHDTEVTNNGYTADYKAVHCWAYLNGNDMKFYSFMEFEVDDWGVQAMYTDSVTENQLPLPDNFVEKLIAENMEEFLMTHADVRKAIMR